MNRLPESRFTAPHIWCPRPELWTSPDSDGTEFEVITLVAAMVTALQPDLVLETGTSKGYCAVAIGRALRENKHGHLHTFEVVPAIHAEAVQRTASLPVTCHLSSSLDFTPSGPVDFIWFDSLIDLRVPEFRRYRQWMHRRTVVGFHDTGPQHHLRPQLSVLQEEGLQMIDLPTPRGVVFGRVWS